MIGMCRYLSKESVSERVRKQETWFNNKKFAIDQKFHHLLEDKESIRVVKFSDKELNEAGMQVLCDILKMNTIEVNYLIFEKFCFSPTSMKYLRNALISNQSLGALLLYQVSLCSKGLEYLAETLEGNQSLKSFELTGSKIDDTSMKKLLSIFEVKKNIKTLGVCVNGIASNEMKMLCETLKCNDRIESLILHGKLVNENGIKPICTLLKASQNLNKLILKNEGCNNKAIEQLFKALKVNQSLHTLILGEVRIEDLHELDAALQWNQSLHVVKVRLTMSEFKSRIWENIKKKLEWNQKNQETVNYIKSIRSNVNQEQMKQLNQKVMDLQGEVLRHVSELCYLREELKNKEVQIQMLQKEQQIDQATRDKSKTFIDLFSKFRSNNFHQWIQKFTQLYWEWEQSLLSTEKKLEQPTNELHSEVDKDPTSYSQEVENEDTFAQFDNINPEAVRSKISETMTQFDETFGYSVHELQEIFEYMGIGKSLPWYNSYKNMIYCIDQVISMKEEPQLK